RSARAPRPSRSCIACSAASVARPRRRVASALAVPCLALLAAACGLERTHAAPSITITRVPPVDPGGTPRLGTIEGRVDGAPPGARVVLYARSGAWYVQPFADRPFTEVRPDGTWMSQTHLGTEYAALLVGPGFEPSAVAASLPGPGPRIAA